VTQANPQDVKALITAAKILVIDDEIYTRKVIRTLLLAAGISKIHEAEDGFRGLQAVRSLLPDVVICDWEMPCINGPEFVREVRSPGIFPHPEVPIIMLTAHGERSRVLEAARLGVHEFLIKPVSSNALVARIAAVLTTPRPMIRRGNYYGPEPRKLATYKPDTDSFAPRAIGAVDAPPSSVVFLD
jgi:two-component system, chemotaxis family, chemotaxis protein CheY